jgi:hypothetical protein
MEKFAILLWGTRMNPLLFSRMIGKLTTNRLCYQPLLLLQVKAKFQGLTGTKQQIPALIITGTCQAS